MKEYIFKFTDFGTTTEYESFYGETQYDAEKQAIAYARGMELSYEFVGVDK